ncbi:MAG TPA: D-aminoacylase [Bryobacteraceae bacterium]|nr:D-aminoacylase [Bryobacteraceae bacterium]
MAEGEELKPALLCAAACLICTAQTYDLVITGARVVDGTGSPWYRADVAVLQGRIAAIGSLSSVAAAVRISADGLVVAPGFIDMHSHAGRSVDGNPLLESLARQGITTLLEGQDGGSPIPLRPALDKLQALRPALNFGYFAGHNAIRSTVMGSENRHATAAEIDRMKALAREAMVDGAFGLSTGLFYVPGNYAPTEEVIQLARVVAPFGGMHISHIRDEASGVLDSVRETIRIGEQGGVPTQVTHHKIIGKAYWGRSKQTLHLVDEARARGVDVTIDQYPYTASSTGTAALFPQWSLSGGAKALAERVNAPESRARIKAEIARRIREDRGGGDPANVQFASCGFDRSLDGKTLSDATRAAGLEPTPENAADTMISLQLKGGCSAIYHAIGEEDVVRILQSPNTMVATDGHAPVPGDGVPHPRSYGTFPRVLGRYVRDRKILTLEEAIRRMTGLPASRLKLQDRGLIRVGMSADLVAFDPATITDRSEFARPHQYSEGVRHLIVNGVPVLRDGVMTGERPGKVLFGPGRR